MTIPVGIDLGTTNSAAAFVDASGCSTMIANDEGDLLTPSVVLFEDDRVIVGKEARHASTTDPDRVAEWVKRDMGQAAYQRRIHGKSIPPEVIQACILHKLERSVSSTVGDDYKVVVTVPAYFDEPRRTATAAAGEMAGLRVLDIVNEPTAAALAFGESLGYLNRFGDVRKPMNVLVYDLGGGTFDVTVLRLAPGDIRTLATDGDVQLGGHDWDMRLVDHLAAEFQSLHGQDLRSDPVGFYRLYNAAVEAKHTLTARMKAKIRVAHRGNALEQELSRGKFDLMTADLLERTSHTVRQVLRTAEMSMEQIDRVLLVGGSTRMPSVAKMLEKLGAIGPARNVNPDEAVARGAAIYARFLMQTGGKSSSEAALSVTNVNSHTLGLEGIDQEARRKVVKPVIPKNTPLPVKKTKKFCTKEDNQRSLVIHVVEGESRDPEDCTSVGRTVVRNLPGGLKRGHPVRVTFEYGTNGRLTVHAEIPETDCEIDFELRRSAGLSKEMIDQWKSLVMTDKGFADFELAAGVEMYGPRSQPSAPEEEEESDWDDDPDDIFALAMKEQKEEAKKAPPGAVRRAPSSPRREAPAQPQSPAPSRPSQASAARHEQVITPRRGVPVRDVADRASQPDAAKKATKVASRPGKATASVQSGSTWDSTIAKAAEAADAEKAARSTKQADEIRQGYIFMIGVIFFGALGLTAGYFLIKYGFPMLGLPAPW